MTDDVSDDALADLGARVRRAQRCNMLVRLLAVLLVAGLFVLGLWIRSAFGERGAHWAGGILGLIAAVAMISKLEVPIEDID